MSALLVSSLEDMFKEPKDVECVQCKAPIPKCAFKIEGCCTMPEKHSETTDVEPCDGDNRKCPLRLCYPCRIRLREQVGLLERMDKVLETEAEAHLKRPYKREFILDTDGISCAMPELPGCLSCLDRGYPIEEISTLYLANRNLQEAAVGWLMACIESGEDVPKPEMED